MTLKYENGSFSIISVYSVRYMWHEIERSYPYSKYYLGIAPFC